MDNIFSWAKNSDNFIQDLTCQLDVCLSQNLTLSLKKSCLCPDRMDFFGQGICVNGNCPAMSKHALIALMEHWPSFVTIRDVVSFVGFLNFYSIYIPCFEQRIVSLRDLTKLEMGTVIADLLNPAQAAKLDMIDAICSDPCIA